MAEQFGGFAEAPTASFTRPANTTQYTDGDEVSNHATAGSAVPMQFTCARESGKTGRILGARLVKSTNTTTAAAFRLWLIQEAKAAMQGDNAAFVLTLAEARGVIGYIDFVAGTTETAKAGAWQTFTGVAYQGAVGTRPVMPFDLPTGQIVYGYLQAKGDYTPGNAETFFVTLDIEQD